MAPLFPDYLAWIRSGPCLGHIRRLGCTTVCQSRADAYRYSRSHDIRSDAYPDSHANVGADFGTDVDSDTSPNLNGDFHAYADKHANTYAYCDANADDHVHPNADSDAGHDRRGDRCTVAKPEDGAGDQLSCQVWQHGGWRRCSARNPCLSFRERMQRHVVQS